MSEAISRLQKAICDESLARDVLVKAISDEHAAIKARQVAQREVDAATRRRTLAYAQSRVMARPAQVAPAPVPTPEREAEMRRVRVCGMAIAALVKAGRPLLAIELGPLIGIAPRAVRPYLDGHPRISLDHVRHEKRSAVRITLI
jgi:hypothetical protein